jgi:O-antigen ligase
VRVRARLPASLSQAASLMAPLGTFLVLVVWASDEAGYAMTRWAPGAIAVLALLVVAMISSRHRIDAVPPPVKLALGCLTAYTALSFASTLWAGDTDASWAGANRTLLYLLVFTLFAVLGQTARSAAALLCSWALAMIVLAALVLIHVDAASASSLSSLIPRGRLAYPIGYANADAAQWMMVFWPATVLARSERVHWLVRGLLAGGAVLLSSLALLSLSRGAVYAAPLMLVFVLLAFDRRLRTFGLLLIVAAGTAAAAPAVLRVGEIAATGANPASAMHHATAAVFIASTAVALVVGLVSALESKQAISPALRGHAARILRVAIASTLIAVIVAVAVSDPLAKIRHGWETFSSPAGYAANGHGNRLTGGLGSNRYDFYRVALDEFVAHPVLGIGADNFQRQYLLHRHSKETPQYPHSVELRILAETGLAGTILALIGLGAAFVAAIRAARPSPPRRAETLTRDVAAAALAGFIYWAIHGSVDWFWEIAGLGASAFALLGLACALTPKEGAEPLKTERSSSPRPSKRSPRIAPGLCPIAVALVCLLAAASFISALSAGSPRHTRSPARPLTPITGAPPR